VFSISGPTKEGAHGTISISSINISSDEIVAAWVLSIGSNYYTTSGKIVSPLQGIVKSHLHCQLVEFERSLYRSKQCE
jgi:hypothetical protein